MTDKFTKAARGRQCMLRLPGCLGTTDTTVLCHIRYASIGGTGLKPPSIVGAWGCFNCHNTLDSRGNASTALPREPQSWEAAALGGLVRTLNELHNEGIVK